MRLLCELGAKKKNIMMVDRQGVIHDGRDDLNIYKKEFVRNTELRTLAQVMVDADVLIGVSGKDLVTAEMVKTMAKKPIVFALSNPDPEIEPEIALKARPDLIMATGRSDYPNQVNNALGFPYVFRGALDVQARTINRAMAIACVGALRAIAKEPVPEEVLRAYNLKSLQYGHDYIIPKPLDPRLIDRVPPAVAKAAIDTGVARAPYPAHYRKY
jgi:malate dehydrogenase (oxaloacetate-decarboxylating)(NADP+)